jgi:transcription-repair coupling factor (superfamily II helicase)
MQMGIERLVLKNNKMTAYFIQNSESYFYKSQVFQKILHNIQKMAGSCHMQEKNNKLTLTFSNIQSIESALKKLNQTGN